MIKKLEKFIELYIVKYLFHLASPLSLYSRFKPVGAIFVCADTTPPKKQITDMSQDFYSAGFAPGAIVYFSYDQSRGQ